MQPVDPTSSSADPLHMALMCCFFVAQLGTLKLPRLLLFRRYVCRIGLIEDKTGHRMKKCGRLKLTETGVIATLLTTYASTGEQFIIALPMMRARAGRTSDELPRSWGQRAFLGTLPLRPKAPKACAVRFGRCGLPFTAAH